MKRILKGAFLGLLVLGLPACDDLLDVSDPQRYTSDDLDTALPAVANGVEGAVHEVIDSWVIYQALLGDTYAHTGTWNGYDEVDHGRFQYGTSAMDDTMNSLLRARWFAGDAEARFNRVLGESDAASSPLMAQVRLGAALADLYMGLAYCEAPGDAEGPAVSDQQLYQLAITGFTNTIATAQAAGAPDIAIAATAGRARAKQMSGDYAGAAMDASTVADDFEYLAKFNQQSTNSVVTLTTATFNQAGGLMQKWWSQVDADANGASYMRDPYTGEFDMRIPVYFDGDVATDNATLHYSQWKYQKETDDIPMLTGHEMRLIEAEAAMRNSDFDGAMGFINDLRDKVGLAPIAVPTTDEEMEEILLSERFAELFMTGMRAVDMHRFGNTRTIFDAMGDAERPGGDRPTKFSMSDTEANLNPNIADDLAQRCLPMS